MEWSTSLVFRLPHEATHATTEGDTIIRPLTIPSVPARLAEAVAMGPDAVKACAEKLTAFTDTVGQSALLRKAVQEHVPEPYQRVWCDTLLRDNSYARLLAMAFGVDPCSMISGFLLPTNDWRVILNDTASRHPITDYRKRERESVVNDAGNDIAPVVTSNCFSSMCASCTAVTHSVSAADRMGRAMKQMAKNRTAKLSAEK